MRRPRLAWDALQADTNNVKLLKKSFKISVDLQAAVVPALAADCLMTADTDIFVYGVMRAIAMWNVHDDKCLWCS